MALSFVVAMARDRPDRWQRIIRPNIAPDWIRETVVDSNMGATPKAGDEGGGRPLVTA